MDLFVSDEKRQALAGRMTRLGIREADLEEQFVLGAGRGGQKLNKTHSCVQLKHLPSGMVLKCQRTRARELNRYLARYELCERLQARVDEAATERACRIARVRRQKRRRSRRQKEHVLRDKRLQGLKKQGRRSVQVEE